MQARGARPVTYLPGDSTTQQRYFEMVKTAAFGPVFDPSDRLWRDTPFIDYPRIAKDEGEVSSSDWRWEVEWRVQGDLTIDNPARFKALFAPETEHEGLQHSWLWEVVGPDYGTVPALIDVRWPAARKIEALGRGSTPVVDEIWTLGDHEREAGLDPDPPVDSWVDDSQRVDDERVEGPTGLTRWNATTSTSAPFSECNLAGRAAQEAIGAGHLHAPP
jgi:hypothetical protein